MRTFLKIALLLFVLSACEDTIYVKQPLVLTENNNFKDWVDYRSAELGLYALQQKLVEQLIILGELRGDLVQVSSNADADLIEIQNFNVSSTNKYASANNFYTLIAACNALIRTLELNHPEVKEDNPSVNDYHRIYGEALCMRGWAYFNAARIYGKIPYIPEELTDYKDIIDYVMNPESTYFVDSGRYMYDINGLDTLDLNDTIYYPVDTVYIDTVEYETFPRRFIDLRTVVERVTYDLTQRLNYVGVDYANKDNVSENEWEAIIWTEFSKDYLLGQMALTVGDVNAALAYFTPILYNYDYLNVANSAIRFGLDDALANENWASIFQSININEHIFTVWFGKKELQTHQLQRLFDNSGTNLYYLKPTHKAILLWETEWVGQAPAASELWNGSEILPLVRTGEPGDFYRGYKTSYIYKNGGHILTKGEVKQMLDYKKDEKYVEVENIMRNVDTLVYKYTRNIYDNDAFVPLYRASSVHLYAAEISLYSEYFGSGGARIYRVSQASQFMDGTYNRNADQLGVRGRVSLPEKPLDIKVLVFQDPFTNQITGKRDFVAESGGDPLKELDLKRVYYEGVILAERGKELAFEGERFYDIMRIAQKHNDPSYLANTIADSPGKYSSELREEIRTKLMNEENWFIPFYLSGSE